MQELYANILPSWKKEFDKISQTDWDTFFKTTPKGFLKPELFKPFTVTPLENLKVVVFGRLPACIGDENTHFGTYGVAEFKSEYVRETRMMYNLPETDKKKLDYETISKQGVLFINTSLTNSSSNWESIIQKILENVYSRGWIISLTIHSNPTYINFVKHLVNQHDFNIWLKVKTNKAEQTDKGITPIVNSGIFFKINSYLQQWYMEPIEW